MLYGGLGDNGEILGDTWLYQNGSWEEVTFDLDPPDPEPEPPSARYGASMVFHPGKGVVVMYGGQDAAGWLPETWIWNGTTWMRRLVEDPPPVWPDSNSSRFDR